MIEQVRLPEISEGVETGDVLEILVEVGEFIEKDQSIVELETEKATLEMPSPVTGMVTGINTQRGETISVGQVILEVDTEAKKGQTPLPPKPVPAKAPAEPVRAAPEPVAAPAPELPAPTGGASMAAGPGVRQLARELGVDINSVPATGPEGLISADDVKNYTRAVVTGGGQVASTSQPAARPLPDFAKFGSVRREPMSSTRKKIADTIGYAWSHIPHVTQHGKADITELAEFRREYGKRVADAGGKLTVTSIMLKVAASALKAFPKFNASYDDAAEEIVYKDYCNIAVAVDTDRGLLVPVIRDVGGKSILQLSVELTDLAQRTRDKKVSVDELVGGNFTISNLGGIGGTTFAPIIYWPQVAILGLGRASREPVYIDGQLQPRLMLPLSLSYDHRVIDGADGARFLVWIARALEEPFLLALEEQD